MREIAIVLWVTLFPLATVTAKYISLKIGELKKQDDISKEAQFILNCIELITFFAGWYLLAI